MRFYYSGECEPEQNINHSEIARETLMKEDDKMVPKRRFEWIYNIMECKTYMKNEVIPEKKEIIVYGNKHIKTDKTDSFVLIGSQLDEIYENDKLFNFWSIKFYKWRDREMGFQDNKMVFYNLS